MCRTALSAIPIKVNSVELSTTRDPQFVTLRLTFEGSRLEKLFSR